MLKQASPVKVTRCQVALWPFPARSGQCLQLLTYLVVLLWFLHGRGALGQEEQTGGPTEIPTADISGQGRSGTAPTAGSTTVTEPDYFTGRFRYSIPLDLPPARGKVAPDLTLKYSSSGTPTILGIGWDIALGSIERDRSFGVEYDASDFVLRSGTAKVTLIKAGSDFYTQEVDSVYRQFQLVRGTSGAVDHWIVKDRAGTTWTYGESDSSRMFDLKRPDRVAVWYLERVEDYSGNYLSIEYERDQGTVYPAALKYTGSKESNPFTRVLFKYENRPDTATTYTWGFKTVLARRLLRMEVTVSDGSTQQLLFQEAFRYDDAVTNKSVSPSTGRSLLRAIDRLFGLQQEQSIRPTTFKYADEEVAFDAKDWPGPATGGKNRYEVAHTSARLNLSFKANCFGGDFDGDGRQDLACAGGAPGVWTVAKSDGSGWVPQNWSNGPVSAAVAKAACWAADFNGDGKTDLVCIQGQSSVDWGISNGAGFVTRRDQLSLASIQVPLGEHCLVGTFRPKKASELLCIAPNGGTIRLSYADPSEVSLPGPSFAPIAAAPAKNCFAVDLTGDHTTDLACSVAGRWLVAISDGGAWGAMQDWGPNGISDNELTRNCLIGEFNGDEKTDILCKAAPGWVRYISTGSGLDALSLVGGPPVSGSVSDNCMLANFTGDGTTAVLCHRPGYGNSCGDQTSDWEDTPVSRFQPDQCKRISPACEEVGDIDKEDDGIVDGRHKMRVRAHCAVYSNSWTYASVGDTNWKQVRELSITTLGPSLLDACVAADVFGEGRSSVICQTIDHRFTRATNQGFPNDLLTTITTPIGGTTRIEYGPAAGFDRSLSLPLLVATASQLDDGNGTISRLDYRYSGGVYLPLLRDFRGFNQVEIVSGVSDDGMQKHRLLTFMQGGIAQDGSEVPADPYGAMRGLLKSEQVKDSNGILQSTKSFSYQLPTSATPPFFTPLQSFEYSLQSSTLPITAKHVYKYNARGDILQDTYTSATSTEDYLLVRTYDEPPAAWPLSYLVKQIVYKGLTADRTAELQHLEFGYSSTEQCSHPKREALGLSSPELPTAVTWVNTDGTAETAYNSFDMYGNLECSQDPLGRQTFYVYDALHIEPTEIHLPKTGHIIKYKYYDTQSQNIGAAYAKLESLISPSGATTTFKYDVAGRPKEIKDSLGALWTYAYLNFGQPGKQNISLMAGDLIKEDAYFDGLGRIVRTNRTESSGRSLSTDTNYNNAGLISRASLPYFTADEQTGYVAHKYDFMQRAIEQVNSNGDDDQFCYLPLQQVHLDANRHFEHTTYDFNGQMLSSAIYESDAKSCADALRVVQEQSLAPYSEDKYQFDPSGRLVLWTDPGNSKRSWTFDGLGHLTSVDAPEEGVVHFAYDRVGNLTSKTYPNGTNRTPIFYKYDALNRLTQKTYGQATKPFSDIDWGFGYDEGVTANRGLLTSVRRHAQVVSRFSYYFPGRLLEEQTTLEGTTYSLHYGYDDIGRISRLSQDGLSALEFTYSGSALVKMGTGSTAIRFEDYSASERPGRIVYPDGTETEISYCSALNPSCRRPTFQTAHIKSIHNGSVLLDETYAYDGVGNLSKLKGSNFDYTYSYDNVDRLVRSHDASLQAGDPSDRSVNYDSRGNITAYDGASYSYKQVVGDRGYVLKQAGATTYDYWDWGAVKSIIENGQKKWRIQYNPEGAPSEVFSPSGRNLLEYDWQGRLLYRSTGPNVPPSTLFPNGYTVCERGSCQWRLDFSGRPLGRIGSGDDEFYISDRLGSMRRTVSASSSKQARVIYSLFGDPDRKLSAQPVWFPGFAGMLYDERIQMYIDGGRLYDPRIGRFMSPDIGDIEPSRTQQLNRFSYSLNNPLRYRDLSGLAAEDDDDNARISTRPTHDQADHNGGFSGRDGMITFSLDLSGLFGGSSRNDRRDRSRDSFDARPEINHADHATGSESHHSSNAAKNSEDVPYTGAPDLPLYSPVLDPIDILAGGISSIGLSVYRGIAASVIATTTEDVVARSSVSFVGEVGVVGKSIPLQSPAGELINGRWFTSHALSRITERGIPMMAVTDALEKGVESMGSKPFTWVSTSRGGTQVVTNEFGDVVTVLQSSRAAH